MRLIEIVLPFITKRTQDSKFVVAFYNTSLSSISLTIHVITLTHLVLTNHYSKCSITKRKTSFQKLQLFSHLKMMLRESSPDMFCGQRTVSE